MKGLVLAAGRGKRLNDITQGENKCLIKLNGKAVIQYAVEKLCNIKEITECVVVVGYKAEEVMKIIGNEVAGIKITYCRQYEQKGLIHALETATEALRGDDFMMVLGDEVILDNQYQKSVTDFLQSDDMCKIGIIEVDDIELVKKTYTFRYDEQLHMIDFWEKPDKPYNNFMGTGNVLFGEEVLDMLDQVPVNPIRGERELVGLFNLLIEQKKHISSFVVGSQYINLNTRNDLEMLQQTLKEAIVEV